MNHLQQLTLHEPNLKQMRILDVGAGKGGFMMQTLDEGIEVFGLEKNAENIQIAKQKMAEKKLRSKSYYSRVGRNITLRK